MDFSRQFNELEEIFQDYRRMELRIQERLISGAPPEELAALCEQYLGNPIILMDNSFSLLLRPRRTNPLDWERDGILSRPPVCLRKWSVRSG